MMDALVALVLAGSQWSLIWGVLMLLVAVTALAVLGRRSILALLRPLLRWLGFQTSDVAPLDERSKTVPAQLQVVEQAMVRTHRARPHVQPARHPELPTQVLPRVDDDATQVLPNAALNSPTQVLYIVLPVDERERVIGGRTGREGHR